VRRAVEAAAGESADQRVLYFRDVAVAAEFADEPAGAPQRAPDARNHRVRIFNPVEHGIAEYRVEFVGEAQIAGAHHASIEAEFARGFDLRGARIHADHTASEGGEFRRQRAIAAAEIENAFAGARRQQFDNGRAEFGDEARVARIAFRIPRLRNCGRGIRFVGHGG
jgi:hypothetical protein